MHYTGTIWRPPYEAASLLLEVTAGCTHHKCKFCTLYDDIPFQFRMSPSEDVEADLKEAKSHFRLWHSHKVLRTFLTGANPFVLKYERLMAIADLIKQYFPDNKTIGCFSRITDISYKFFYLTSISGAGNGEKGAKATADICNQLHPKLIGANMLTIYPNSELYKEIECGNWAEESEIEKYKELKVLVENLQIPTEFAALGASNAVQIQGYLPKDKQKILNILNEIINPMPDVSF